MTAILNHLKVILNAFEDVRITPYQFLHRILTTNIFEDHIVTESLAQDVGSILSLFKSSTFTAASTQQWVFYVAEDQYTFQVLELTRKQTGFWFQAAKTTEDQLKQFSVDETATQMCHCAPDLWGLLAALLTADPVANHKCAQRAYRKAKTGSPKQNYECHTNDGDFLMEHAFNVSAEDHDWELLNGDVELIDGDDDISEDLEDQVNAQVNALIVIKQVLCLSVIMQSSNQLCNALQTIIGIFLHVSGAPEMVQELLAHISLSISMTSINNTVSSLSKESKQGI